MAKTIRCDSCKAADVKKIGEKEYICNFCNSRIILDDPKVDVNSFFKTFNPNSVYKVTQTTITPDATTITKNASRLGCLIGIIALIGGAAGIIIPFLGSNNQSTNTVTPDGWQISYTSQVYYTWGSKGPAVWVFTEENQNWKLNRKRLSIINPIDNKEIFTDTIGKEVESGNTVPSIWDMFQGGKTIGDTIYFSPKGKVFEGRNIYNAKIVINKKYFADKGVEIAQSTSYNSSKDNYLSIKSAEGDEYYFFPQTKEFVLTEEFRKKKEDKKVSRYYFVLTGNSDKKAVLRIQQELKKDERAGYFNGSKKEFSKNLKYYNRYYNITAVDSVPAANHFFDAEFIDWNDTSFIIKYKKNILENTPQFVGCYTVSGKQLWSYDLTNMKELRDDKKVTDNFQFQYQPGKLIVYIIGAKKAAIGINTVSGKMEWNFNVVK